MDRCAAEFEPVAVLHPENSENALGLKLEPELIPGKKGCVRRNIGPPFAGWELRSPARLSADCAVNSEFSRSRICWSWESGGACVGSV